ncbi:hypothetical protein S1OALGB6SA_1047 [Olavius algarvensis spirochete endosymbiont]|nr:MAG: hypothetical protein [Olavius algarvensis spirochete endosymbiont]VDA99973.1 hypothetical protein S1OALGB6SA_1047 [Olavius algarvensis spirochete endosymbiont]
MIGMVYSGVSGLAILTDHLAIYLSLVLPKKLNYRSSEPFT